MASSSFFFNDTATTEIYTLSLHDALPIYERGGGRGEHHVHGRSVLGEPPGQRAALVAGDPARQDRKSTRLNSSHSQISYAVFCLKKKKKNGLTPATLRCLNYTTYVHHGVR